MTHILTNTGREHALLPPLSASTEPHSQPSLAEVAWSLAHINRYTGHARRAYSVAEHSLLVADIAAARGLNAMGQLCALMHDAHECIVGDVTSPVKGLLGSLWRSFEDYHQSALLESFGLLGKSCTVYADAIKTCDLIALATERRDLLPYNPQRHMPWPSIDTKGSRLDPHEDVYLMAESRTVKTPGEWADEFTEKAVNLRAAAANGGWM